MESDQEERSFRLLPREEFEALSLDQKMTYINRAIRVLTRRETTIAVIKPPDDESK